MKQDDVVEAANTSRCTLASEALFMARHRLSKEGFGPDDPTIKAINDGIAALSAQHSDLAEQDFKHQVRGAMIDAWNEICSDTGCHPVDIKREGSKLFYTPMHWTDAAANILFTRLTALRSNRAAIREECARLAEQSSAPECHVLAKHIRSLNGGDHD